MSEGFRRDLLWFAALALTLVGIRSYLYSQETVVFAADLPDEKETLTSLFRVHRDTGVRVEVTRIGGSNAQSIEVELFDADGHLLGHEPMFVDKDRGASDALLFALDKGEQSFRILRDVPERDPLHMTVITGAQSHQHFGIAFLALLAPPLLHYARRRRSGRPSTATERSEHGT